MGFFQNVQPIVEMFQYSLDSRISFSNNLHCFTCDDFNLEYFAIPPTFPIKEALVNLILNIQTFETLASLLLDNKPNNKLEKLWIFELCQERESTIQSLIQVGHLTVENICCNSVSCWSMSWYRASTESIQSLQKT